MAQFNIYKVTTKFSNLGTVNLNRYYYRQINTLDSDLDDIKNGFLLDVMDKVQDIVGDNVILTNVEIINLNDQIEFEDFPITGWNGNRLGALMPPYVTWTYKLLRESREFRPGRKAYGGVTEDDVAGGVAVAGIEPALDALALALGDNVTTPVGGTILRPVLARELPGVGVSAFTFITGAEYTAVSTQNSRKFGRGI